MRTIRAVSYLTALREGGSVPAIVEADDDVTSVVKFRGTAQGPRALVAEVIAGELGRRLGLPIPRLVLIEIAPCSRAGLCHDPALSLAQLVERLVLPPR